MAIFIYNAIWRYLYTGILFILRNSLQGIGELVAITVLCLTLSQLINHGPITINANANSLFYLAFADSLEWLVAVSIMSYGAIKYIFKAKEHLEN